MKLFFLFIDLKQVELFLSGLKKIVEKQNGDISMFRNEVRRLNNENKSMLKYYVSLFFYIVKIYILFKINVFIDSFRYVLILYCLKHMFMWKILK